MKHLLALILFGTGTLLGVLGFTRYAVACVSAGLFLVTL